MNSHRTTARIVGALFLISNVVFLTGAFAFVEPTLSAPDYLSLASTNRISVILGVFLELINGVAYIGIAVLMFPIFRRRFESLALAYVAFRTIEFVMQTLSDLSPLVLLTVSEEFVGAGAAEAVALQAVGTLLLAARYWAFHMVSVTLVLGALLFYPMLYRTRLIPRFISVWGFIGALVVLANAVMEMVGFQPGNLGILMLLNEVFLGVWLIVKGFNPSAVASLAGGSDADRV